MLWLNKLVLDNKKPLFEQEFVEAGIIDYFQLVGPFNGYMSYDELANKYQLLPNNISFIKYIKLKVAIPIS